MKSNGEECTFTIVSGRAKGADTNGEKYANTHGYKLDLFPANWDKYGKKSWVFAKYRNGKTR